MYMYMYIYKFIVFFLFCQMNICLLLELDA